MEQIELQVTTREMFGKKVRFLRRQGIIPIHLFGHNVESLALQCDAEQLQRVLGQAGKTRLINLKLDKAKKPRNVIVREVQRDLRTGGLLHVDFYQLVMAEKIKMDVPIVLAGEAPALKSRENTLSQEINSLTIECLPNQIPANVRVDLSPLTEAGQAIRVTDLVLDEKVTILNDPEALVVRVHLRPREKVVEEIVVEEAVEAPEVAVLPEEESKEA